MRIITCLLLLLISCSTPKNEEVSGMDSTILAPDSLAIQKNVEIDPAPVNDGGSTYQIADGAVIDLPEIFTFNLFDTTDLRKILGPDAVFTEQEFEGGEDYGPFSTMTLNYDISELVSYSYAGMHQANIYTPLLVLKEGIKVGMTRAAFLEVFVISESNATTFEIRDDYGSVSFEFKDDLLVSISFYYEYGT